MAAGDFEAHEDTDVVATILVGVVIVADTGAVPGGMLRIKRGREDKTAVHYSTILSFLAHLHEKSVVWPAFTTLVDPLPLETVHLQHSDMSNKQ